MGETGDLPGTDASVGERPAPSTGGGPHAHKPRKGAIQRRLGAALLVFGVVLLIAVVAAAWWYYSFSANVEAANHKIAPDVQHALDTPPPATLVAAPQSSPAENGVTTTVEPLDAVMNVLVLGNDARPGVVEGAGSSDVVMMLHIDTRQDYLSILSVTRDLWVTIPGYGQDRINAAYNRGGPALTIATIKQTFGVDVTKYVGVTFEAFPGLIDSLGGVYVDVDRTYTDTPYWHIDLSPGYQRLSGADALLYSRYRFDKNADFGRMARQQRLLSGLRDQARSWSRKLKLPGIVNTIMSSAATNLSTDEMLRLAYWLVQLDNTRIKQIIIKGPGQMIDGKAVVVVDKAALTQAVTDFLTAPPPDPSQPAEAGTTLLAAAGGQAVALALAATTTTVLPVTTTTQQQSTTTSAAGRILDATAWKAAQKTVPFPLMAPTTLPIGFSYAGKSPEGDGTYAIDAEGGEKPAVRMLYRYRQDDQYLGFSATTWLDAPLANDGEAHDYNGITYTICGSLGNADRVWWRSDGVLYWVSNTLMYTLTEDELLQIAESTRPVPAPVAH